MKHNWEYKKLGEVGTINYGTRIVRKNTSGSKYYVYGGGGPTFMTDDYNREDCFIVSRFAMSPQCTRFVKGRFFLNDSGLSVKTNTDTLKQIYLDKVLLANNDNIYSLGKGAAQKNLDITAFQKLSIPVPPLPIQQQIVDELDKLSEIIEKKKQQVKELDTLAQSIFYDMFGDPDAIFEKWGQMDLIDVCDKIVDCPHTTPIKAGVPTPYPCIRTSELKGGIIHWDSMQYVFEEEYQKRVSRLMPKAGDIIYGREGSFGDAVILPEGWQFCLGQRTMLFRANNGIVNNSYLHRALISEVVLSQAMDKNVASTVAHVNVKDIKRFKIPTPPLPLQQSFAQKIEAIEKQKELINQSIKEAQTLFDARMDYYFGE